MNKRMYNNYDGFMYLIHHISLGTLLYKGTRYHLDDTLASKVLLQQLEKDGILSSTVKWNEFYPERLYKIKEDYLEDIFTKHSIQTTYQQVIPTLLNIRKILEAICSNLTA